MLYAPVCYMPDIPDVNASTMDCCQLEASFFIDETLQGLVFLERRINPYTFVPTFGPSMRACLRLARAWLHRNPKNTLRPIEAFLRHCGPCTANRSGIHILQEEKMSVRKKGHKLKEISADPPGVERVEALCICWSLDPFLFFPVDGRDELLFTFELRPLPL